MASLLRRAFPALSGIREIYRTMMPIQRLASTADNEGMEMQTTVTILNEEQDAGILINAFSNIGFRLNNGIQVIGPMAVFPRSVLHWNVSGVAAINENSLSLFTMLEPKIDILVLGVGERENLARLNGQVIRYLKSHKINLEVLSTDQATSTFNFLNAEKRYVAGAFIPPAYVDAAHSDLAANAGFLDEAVATGDWLAFSDYEHEKIVDVAEQFKNPDQQIQQELRKVSHRSETENTRKPGDRPLPKRTDR